jgi:hypothetical protein
MPPEANKPSGDPVAVRIATLVERIAVLGGKLKRVRDRVSRTEEDMDTIVCELGDLLCELLTIVRCAVALRRVGPTKAPKPIGVNPPSPEVVHVVLVTQSDDSIVLRIKGGACIPLPPSVAALLGILKADGGIREDHLVGWKSVALIQTELKERTNQHRSKAAVKELVFRLRNLLERYGAERRLVQHNRRLGYRFAVRCGAGAVTDRDNQ